MDLTTLVQSAPTAGICTLLLAFIGWLWKGLNDAEKRHADYVSRINHDYDKDISELKSEIAQLRQQIRDLTAEIQTERELRRQAQEEAHRMKMELQ